MSPHTVSTRLRAIAAVLLMAAVTAAPIATPSVAEAQTLRTVPGTPGPHTYAVSPLSLDILVGPNLDIPVTIDADVYRPDDASPTNQMPAMFVQHGFGGTKAGGAERAQAAYFATHGYVVVSVTAQGFGGSTGCIAINRYDYDGQAAAAVFTWLAEQDYVALDAAGDPKVGMIGGSYGGGLSGLVAVNDPRVDAIAPARTWQALQYSLVPNNWIVDAAKPWDLFVHDAGVFKQGWTSLFFASGSASPFQGAGGCDPINQQIAYPGQPPCAGFVPYICQINVSLATTGDATDEMRAFVAAGSLASALDQLTTPTLIAQGLVDTLFTATEATSTFMNLQARDVPVSMFWHSGGHGYAAERTDGEPFGSNFTDDPALLAEFANGYWARRHLAWMERYVRGDETVDTGPAFAWYRDWVDLDANRGDGSAVEAYGTSPTYPATVTTATTLAIDPSTGGLVAPADLVGGASPFLNPPGGTPSDYTEVPNFSAAGGPGDQPPTLMPGQHLTFDTAPFTTATEVSGIPTASLYLSHVAPNDATFFAKVFDVAPDGSATMLRRQVAASRIPTSVLDAGPVEVRLPPMTHLFEEGHALRVIFSTTDQAYYNNKSADILTITSTTATPSTVTLPMVLPEQVSEVPTAQPDAAPVAPPLPSTGGGLALAGFGLLALTGSARRRRA